MAQLDEREKQEIARLFKSGKTMQEIGNNFNVTKQNISVVLKKMGISQAEGGRAVTKVTSFKCKVDDCDLQAARSTGYCAKHHQRYKAHGDPTKLLFGKDRVCMVDGCSSKHKSKGYCNTHYHRWLKTGNVGGAEIRPPGKHLNRGQIRKRKLSDSDLAEIRSQYVPGRNVNHGLTADSLALKFGVSQATIYNVINNKYGTEGEKNF